MYVLVGVFCIFCLVFGFICKIKDVIYKIKYLSKVQICNGYIDDVLVNMSFMCLKIFIYFLRF